MSGRILDRILLTTSSVARRHPWQVILVSLILLAASLTLAWFKLDFQTDRDDLIGSNDALYEDQQRFLAEFPRSDDVVIMVEGGDAHRREVFVDQLALQLEGHPESFYAVFPKVELPFLTSQALLFLPEKELREVVASVREARPFLASLADEGGVENLFGQFEGEKSMGSPVLAPMLPFLNGVFRELERAVESRGRADYESPWGGVLFPGESQELARATADLNDTSFYHTLDGGRTHLLLLRLQNREPKTLALLRSIVADAGKTDPELSIGITGEPLLEHDEMVSSEQDSHRSAVFSIILVAILFSISFRQTARPLAAIFCLALAVGWTVGFTTLVIGHLNLLTISFATILIGLGIDFGIHLLFRYEEEFRKVGEADKALDQALLATGSDIVVGAFSTATAFWAVGLTDFKGVSEIGTIAGSGVILCLISTIVVLPAIISLLDRNRSFDPADAIPLGSRILLAKSEAGLLRRAPVLLGGALCFLLLCWPTISTVGFDYNLLRLQDPSLESVQTELNLIKKGGNTVLFSVAIADDLEGARELKALFEELSAVERVEVLSDLFPERTPAKLAALRELEGLVKDLEVPTLGSSSQGALNGRKLQKMGRGFESLNTLFQAEQSELSLHKDPAVREAAEQFQERMNSLFSKLEVLGPGPIEDSLGAFQKSFFQDLGAMISFLKLQDSTAPLKIEDLPENLRLRSVGVTGKFVLRIFPEKNIWEREALDEFVTQVRGVHQEAIGAPVLIRHHTSILKDAFETSGFYALAAVAVILLLYFRSLKWTLLALFPLGLGVVFMLFVMGMTGVHFNPANFMGLPLLLGIGLDFGIHVLHRVKEEGRANMFDHSTGPATAVSGLTTICGFGTLALGGHQGVASLGLVLASGVTGILLSALVILPAFLRVFWKPMEKSEASTSHQGTLPQSQSA